MSSQLLSSIDSSLTTIQLTNSPKDLVPNAQLQFGKTFTDHMLTISWNSQTGWETPSIKPYQNLSLDPASLVFHYGMECFEGLKAYKGKNGEIRMFRPDMNMKRLNLSSQRLTLPAFDEDELLKCIEKLLKVDERWIPNEKGYSLYIRPTVIATQNYIGVSPSNSALIYVICCPVGPYYPTGFKAVSLYSTKEFVRAWPGGTGSSKVGGNYAPGLKAQQLAAKHNCQQNLWLFGEEDSITEVGTMNFFALMKTSTGSIELVTPPLDGTILPGVTRYSIIDLVSQWGGYKVVERKITMPEVVKASKENRILELFGSGTACIVSPIKEIIYNGQVISIPLDPENPSSQAGPFATKLFETFLSIQSGETESTWSHLVH